MSTYKHGAVASQMPSADMIAPQNGGLIPVYIGIAPVHQLQNYTQSVNKPLLARSFEEACKLCGYHDTNWHEFDLSEPIYAHFKNTIGPIGPIVLINVMDPSTHRSVEKTYTVTLTGGTGKIVNDKVILNTISITGKDLGVDYSAVYSTDGSTVEITALKDLGSSVSVKAFEIDIAQVTHTVVVGGVTDGIKKGLSVLSQVYPELNLIPNILDSPGWSHIKTVRDALIAASKGINGHWQAFVNTNLLATSSVNTIQKAIDWKKSNGYNGANESPCWPCGKNGTRIFHLSTLATLEMCRQAVFNDGYPCESPSNKAIDITCVCLSDGTPVVFDQIEANDLNAKGLKTAIYFGGKHVLWGPHTGAYEFGTAMDPVNIFDGSKLMSLFILNDFQNRYAHLIDTSIKRSTIETIKNDYQERLDRMPLLYGNIEFSEFGNPVSDMVSGDFVFNVSTTPRGMMKSIEGVMRYTVIGYKSLFGGEK